MGLLVVALLAVTLILLSAPIDNGWHEAFGRDAVLWSPPHLLGIIGLAGLAAALLVELGSRDDRASRMFEPVAGGLLLAALAFPVAEYETGVPQFPLTWYLPVLATGAGLALSLVYLARPRRWATTRAALAHLAGLAGVSVLLLLLGFDAPRLPLLVLPALALDVALSRGWSRMARTVLFVGVLYAGYLSVLAFTGSDETPSLTQVAAGLPAALAGSWVTLAVLPAPRSRLRLRVVSATIVLVVLLVAASVARGHDPGNGPDAGRVAWTLKSRGRTLSVRARPDLGRCQVVPLELVARRAGTTVRRRLRRANCTLIGRLKVTTVGRWFVYVEFARGGVRVESWLPLEVRAGKSAANDAARFAYRLQRRPATAVKTILSALLYAMVTVFLLAVVLLIRSSRSIGLSPTESLSEA